MISLFPVGFAFPVRDSTVALNCFVNSAVISSLASSFTSLLITTAFSFPAILIAVYVESVSALSVATILYFPTSFAVLLSVNVTFASVSPSTGAVLESSSTSTKSVSSYVVPPIVIVHFPSAYVAFDEIVTSFASYVFVNTSLSAKLSVSGLLFVITNLGGFVVERYGAKFSLSLVTFVISYEFTFSPSTLSIVTLNLPYAVVNSFVRTSLAPYTLPISKFSAVSSTFLASIVIAAAFPSITNPSYVSSEPVTTIVYVPLFALTFSIENV